jgi:phytoene desaturase
LIKQKVGVVGAGPGGLACAMILANKGFEVTVFEKSEEVGGRNARIDLDDFVFDTGPTFLNMKFILDEVFELCHRKSSDYLNFKLINPMYQLSFENKKVQMSSNKEEMKNEIHLNFPGNEEGLERFYKKEKTRFDRILPSLRRDFSKFFSFFSPKVLGSLPFVYTRGSIYDNLGKYFKDEKLRVCFTFQSKYLGMSPWKCPAAFTMISYVEHEFGVYHVEGGLNQISQAMRKVIEEEGGIVKTKSPIEKLTTKGNKLTGVKLKGEKNPILFDEVVINADFGYAFSNLVDSKKLSKYSPTKIAKKKYSCSTYMMYLGIDKKYPSPHHNIVFAKDYRSNIDDIGEGRLSEDFSFYVQNASITDNTLAPSGKSTVYVLVPVANNFSEIDWEKEKSVLREKVFDAIEDRTSMKDLRAHVEVEKILTPLDWENEYNVYKGATFNLAHNIGQMLYFRPHNRFEELKNCYLVGGGTHPGSGLPTIYLSSMITAGLLAKKNGVELRS